ncbi:hypothetical protein UAW_01849 [Enterococcus haemoperoxidus ATCC BAA-382]|uniref:Response regulatory domain-containing protein n=1 Tax=Enterococcus haemoperoxidus ATCC BAA-382 TaxID=1158608 RepID=R2T8W4_9ENTE|nr:LytTR family DNA-binding domain-containing protein [Enterococcus haemoperoxidus]EOH96684.1 hypothetical protein UAW_01849 [Enterococcus haemoperoxidus ATCC BAA-382]EOT60180.1 hypothetical protein I583_02815 [Enterococcus haemoperoxidus ATCC BAA-382]OJG52609.1 hypothetical protein RV06_GL000917 [Enterococcus haemoperoxidus]
MSKTMTIYIIDDDFMYRKKLQEILASLHFFTDSFSVEIIPVEEQEVFFSSLNVLTINDNDIFLLDIDLQTYYSGIDIAKKIREHNQKAFILFLTNSDDKGIDIINHQIHAMSYLVKGPSLDSHILEEAFYSIKQEILQRVQDKDSYLSFKNFGQIIFVKYNEILYIKSMPGVRNMVVIHTENSEQVVEGTINKLRETADSTYLYTELKSYIINLNHIFSLERATGIIMFDDGSELEVGKRIIDKLRKAL